jgi:UrcA family protein
MTRKTLPLLAAGLASLTVAAAAFAADVTEVRSTRVGYADLNLRNDAGVTYLYARLRNAASRVCEYSSVRVLAAQDCATKALDEAVATVDNDKLTTLHQRSAGVRQVAANTR